MYYEDEGLYDVCEHRFWKREADGKRRCIIVGCGEILADGYFAPAQYTWVEAESRDVRRSPTSYAADWEILRTKAGRYPVTFTTIDGQPCDQTDAYWVTVSIDAERIDGKFYSGFAGNNFASSPATLGPAPLPVQLYAYQLDRLLADGRVEKGA